MTIQLNLEPTFTLDTSYHSPKIFFVIGAGGTGGYLIPNLARQISITNKLRRIEGYDEHKLIIIDADEVSLSNLNRQNFIEKDLGRNKAQVLSARYGVAFETNIQFLDEYIVSTEMLVKVVKSVAKSTHNGAMPVIVDCVDNNKTRVFIHEAVNQLKKEYNAVISLSSGNEFLTGQVVCGFKTRHSQGPSRDYPSWFETPMVTEMFPEILEGGDKLPTELSCDEAAVSHPQNIMVNITAANHLFNFANTLLTAKDTNDELKGLSYFAVTYDTQKGTYRTFLNKETELTRYLA